MWSIKRKKKKGEADQPAQQVQTEDTKGSVAGESGQYALFRRALTALEEAVGPDHTRVAGVCSSLALLCVEERRYEEAEPLFQRALAIEEKWLPSHWASAVLTLDGYATLLRETGRDSEAADLAARAAAIRESYSEESLPDVP